jgi:DNA-binding transcriptional MerR regulator
MLTIGQLADYVGVTVRAVRHYHRRGLLPEPERDASGYRRYDADAVIGLIRIKALADAGVPLARVQRLLAADPAEFAAAVSEIDKDLAARVRGLEAQRHRIAQLTAGDRLFVPPEIADLLDRIRGLGVSARTMQIERDGWILLAARYPRQARTWARAKLAGLADPDFQQLYRAMDETFDWDPADPRLGKVADAIVDFGERHRGDMQGQQADPEHVLTGSPLEDPVAAALLLSRTASMPPAWERLDQLCRDRARARGLTART